MGNTRYKILLIEDDKLDQLAFKRLVKDENLPYDFVIAGSVSEAQSILDTDKFDVVISDYFLGDGTAFDIFNLVKDTPIIVTTGTGDEEVAVQAMKAGACDYLIKDLRRSYLKTVPVTIENAIKHKKMEEILDRKQKNLEAIFDAVPLGMLLVDENMIVKRVNDAVRRMVHRDYPQIINQRVGGALGCVSSTSNEKGCGYGPACAACLLEKTVESVLDSEQPVHEVEIHPTLKVDNKEIAPWLCISAEPVIVKGCKHVVIGVNDISDRKMAEQKIKETMEMKSQFIATVSHELRTPLACMKEALGIVLDGAAGKINNEQRNFLDIAKRNADRLALLISDVLDFQMLKADKMSLNIQENDINEAVGAVHKAMVLSAEKKGVDFSLKLEDNLPKARFDSDRIIQVLTNLIDNAIKFTPEQGRVSVCVGHQGEELVIRIKDTGMGIPKEALPKIFDRFYRVPRPGRQIQGTGLGLAIVNKIVMMHSGRIEVESEVDRGTTFTIFLPLDAKSVPEVSHTKMDEILENSLANSSIIDNR